MYGVGPQRTRERIAELRELFELESFLDELAETYSHGMKQRVVVSAALLHEPRVIVIDEPMVGLDPKGANTLKNVLRGLARQGVTVFMSTHTLAVAEQTADRIGIIRSGRIIALGTLDEVYGTARTEKRLEEAFLRLTEEAE
jgi:ABC-2 type transport system ATP-binding protein